MINLTHKFEIKNKHKLDNEKRRKDMPPYSTLEMLGFKGKSDMADIGCGIGYFSIPAAEIAGASHKVYALDVSAEMLEEVEKRMLEACLPNIRNINVDEYDLKLDDESVGFAFMCNVLHEIEDKKRYICEIRRILKTQGKLAIIEWEKTVTESGPPFEHRISYEEVSEILSNNGFNNIEKYKIGQACYGITAIKHL